MVERDEGVERGAGLVDAPGRLLGCAQALRPRGARLGQPVGAGDRRDEAVEGQLIDDRLDDLRRREDGVGQALRAGRSP